MEVKNACALVGAAGLAIALGGMAYGAAPPGRYTIENGTVRDNRTGLIWQQSIRFENQASGVTYCVGLSLGGMSSGWHLPTIAEILSLVDPTRSDPAIDTGTFTNVDGYTWSSTPYKPSASLGWAVDFSDGSADPVSTAATYTIRCVHP